MTLSGKDAILLGSIAQGEFERNGGFTREKRDEIIEGMSTVVTVLLAYQERLLSDEDCTLDWVSMSDLTSLNAAVQLLNLTRESFVFNAVMLRGADLMLSDMREGLGLAKGDR